METKVCAGPCRRKLLPSEFGVNRAEKDGLHRYCRECANKKNAEWRAANPERVAAQSVRYRAKNREKINAAMRLRSITHRDSIQAAK